MKNLIFLFLLAFAVNACSSDDATTSEEVLLPVISVIMPSAYAVDAISTIKVSYRRPTDCHIFNGFYITSEDNNSTVGIKALKFNQQNCMNDDESVYEIPLNWTPTSAGEYKFKFWTGDDAAGVAQFIEHTIMVE